MASIPTPTRRRPIYKIGSSRLHIIGLLIIASFASQFSWQVSHPQALVGLAVLRCSSQALSRRVGPALAENADQCLRVMVTGCSINTLWDMPYSRNPGLKFGSARPAADVNHSWGV